MHDSPGPHPSVRDAAPVRAPLRMRLLDSVAALETARPEWQRLFENDTGATPFQSPAWVIPWAERFAPARVHALALDRGGELVAMAPLVWDDGPLGRTLRFLGHGISDYGGLIAAADEPAAAEAVFAALLEVGTWDACDLEQLPPGEPLLEAPAPVGLGDRRMDDDVCPALSLPGTLDELRHLLPHDMGRRAERYLRRLHREARTTFERARPDTLDELVTAFFRLHAARWQRARHSGVLTDDAVQAFHRDVARGALARGTLRLYALRMDGRIVATVYGFAHGARFCSYLGGFDPALASLSLGTVMLWLVMGACIEEGIRTFDFLRGPEPYKYRWGAVDRRNQRRLVTRARGAAP